MQKIISRIRRWVTTGWGCVGGLGLLALVRKGWTTIWHRIGDFDLMHTVWGLSGADMPTIVRIVTNPLFGVGLIAVSIVGLPAVIREQEGKALGKSWVVVGWGVFVVSAVAVISTLMFGDFVFSSGALRARNFYMDNHILEEGGRISQRHLTPEQMTSLVKGISDSSALKVTPFTIQSTADEESQKYAQDFVKAFIRADAPIQTAGIGPREDDEYGVIVALVKPEHPSKEASDIIDIFNNSHIKFQIKKWIDQPDKPGYPNVVVFITVPKV